MIARRLSGLVGHRFGRWLVRAVQSHGSQGYLSCMCDCGTDRAVRVNRLEGGTSRSCGCLAAEEFTVRQTKHGWRPKGKWNATYKAWQSMRERCLNSKNRAWLRYGGRGIKVCERWTMFANFLADMGDRPAGRSLDRINNDGDYEPGNCRWATNTEQQNNRAVNRTLTLNGMSKTIARWAKDTGIGYTTIMERLRRGWSVKRALTEPVRSGG